MSRVGRIAFAAAALALGTGLFALGGRSLWYDEVASLKFSETVRSAWADNNMSAYYLLLHLLRHGELPSLVALRIPSVVCFALWVGLGVLVLRRHLGASGARCLAAAAVLAAHPLLLARAQEARGYPLAGCLLMSATLVLLELARRPRWILVAALGASGALAAYAHSFVLLFLAAQLAVAFLFPPRTGVRLRLALAGALLAALAGPLVVRSLSAGGEQISWIAKPSLHAVVALLAQVGGGYGMVESLGLALIFAVAAAALRGGPPDEDPDHRVARRVIVAAAIAPILGGLALSLHQSTLLPRYYAFATPYLVIAVATQLGLGGARPWLGRLSLAGFVVAAATTFVGTWQYYTRGRNEGWRDAYELVKAEQRPGDLLALPGVSGPFLYYATRDGGLVEVRRVGSCGAWVFGKACAPAPIDVALADGAPHRLWLVSNRGGQEVVDDAARRLRRELHREFGEWPSGSAFADPRGGIVTVDRFGP